jgi:hypothetical protein
MPEREHTRNSQVSLGCSSLYLLAAWACLVSATVLCEFVVVTGEEGDGGATTNVSRGIWKGTSDVNAGGCGNYGGVYIDSKWKTAKAFSIIGCFVGGTAVLPLVCACGKKLFMSQVVSMSGSCMWSCLFAGLTLLMLRSSACDVDGLVNTSCGLGVGAKLAISSTVLFFITSISMNCTFMAAVITQEMEAQQAEAGSDGFHDPES